MLHAAVMKTLLIIFLSFALCNAEISFQEEDEHVGNPDDFVKIEQSDHAKCTTSSASAPDRTSHSDYTVYFNNVNVTAVLNNQDIRGLITTRIEEFYINKAINKIVFAINIRNLVQSSPSIYLLFQRRGKEPVVTPISSNAYYSSVTFTAVIPNIDDLQLEKAEVTAYLDSTPAFDVSPDIARDSEDPEVAGELAAIFTQPALDFQNYELTDSTFYPTFYIQNTICDFGLKVI